MKILYLAPESTIYLDMSGGAGTHMRGTVNHLKKNNEVQVLIGGDLLNPHRSDFNNELSAKPSKKSLKDWVKPLIPNSIRKLKEDIRRLKDNQKVTRLSLNNIDSKDLPDVIYERSGYGFNTGRILSEKFDIPLVLESDVTILDLVKPSSSFMFNKFFFKRREKKKMDAAKSIVVMSIPSIHLAKKIWKLKHDNIFFKGLGIDLNESTNLEKVNVTEKYNLQGKKVVGYVGIFQDYQNIPIIFEVAEKLKNNKEIIFLLIGTGKRIDEYKSEIRSRGLDNVIFTGIIDKSKIRSYYDAIDIGLITDNASHMYPVKFLEFINYEKPTLVPDYKVFKTFFKDETTAQQYVFTPRNSEDLKQKIQNILERPKESKDQLEYSINKVRDEYTWKKCSDRLIQVLEKTVS